MPCIDIDPTKKSVSDHARHSRVCALEFPIGWDFLRRVRKLAVVAQLVCCAPASCVGRFSMEEFEPTFKNRPSSRAIRARAFHWVLTRSSNSRWIWRGGVDFVAGNAHCGDKPETSRRVGRPLAGFQSVRRIASRKRATRQNREHRGNCVFIEDSPEWISVSIRSYWTA